MSALIVAVAVLLFISALASGTEAALFAVPYGQVVAAQHQRRRGAATLRQLKNDMSRPIMAIVVVNNLTNIAGSIAVGSMAGRLFGATWLSLFSACLTFAVIIYAEIIPKTLGERYATEIALLTAPPVALLTTLLTPLLLAIELLVRPIVGDAQVVPVSEAEIRALTHAGLQAGVIEDDESELIHRVFRLNDTSARSIMTPIQDVDLLDAATPTATLRDDILALTHSRIPVYEGDIDNITGVVLTRDLLHALVAGTDGPVGRLAQPTAFLPGSLAADDLLQHFRNTQHHLAMLADEGGTTIGVVSLEDVLEELVGEILDETDIATPSIRRIAPRTLLVSASADLREINEVLGTTMPPGHLGERIIEALGHIPTRGETVDLGEVVATVVDATPRRVESLLIEAPPE